MAQEAGNISSFTVLRRTHSQNGMQIAFSDCGMEPMKNKRRAAAGGLVVARRIGRIGAVEQALILKSTDTEINESDSLAAKMGVQTTKFLRQVDVGEFGAEEFQNTELDEVQKHRTGTGLCD